MAEFTVTGDVDPFLHVSLKKGESIYCESNAMVMMEGALDLKGSIQGGLLQAAMRKLANGESFFQQHIMATRGDGDCLLAASMPGGLELLDVGHRQYCIADGAYVAASEDVRLTAQMQSLGNAIFANSGGFFIGQTSGRGKVAVEGFGSIFKLNVEPGKEMIIDNGHLVAWDSSLDYRIAVTTNKSAGFLGNIVNSVTSGEGLTLTFTGSGEIIVCSRNKDQFIDWISSEIMPQRSA